MRRECINSIRMMMKFFVLLFASACLVAVVFADFDFDRYNRLVRRGNHANADCTALQLNV